MSSERERGGEGGREGGGREGGREEVGREGGREREKSRIQLLFRTIKHYKYYTFSNVPIQLLVIIFPSLCILGKS